MDWGKYGLSGVVEGLGSESSFQLWSVSFRFTVCYKLIFLAGCSMAAVTLYTVVIKEGAIPKLLEVLLIVLIGGEPNLSLQ
jgi:hypothetical protein